MKYFTRFFILLTVITLIAVVFSCGCCLTKSATTKSTSPLPPSSVPTSVPTEDSTGIPTGGATAPTPIDNGEIQTLPPGPQNTKVTNSNNQTSDDNNGQTVAETKTETPKRDDTVNVSSDGTGIAQTAVQFKEDNDKNSNEIKQVNGEETVNTSSQPSQNTTQQSAEKDKEIKALPPVDHPDSDSGGLSSPDGFPSDANGFVKDSNPSPKSEVCTDSSLGSSKLNFSNVSDHQTEPVSSSADIVNDSFSKLPKLPKNEKAGFPEQVHASKEIVGNDTVSQPADAEGKSKKENDSSAVSESKTAENSKQKNDGNTAEKDKVNSNSNKVDNDTKVDKGAVSDKDNKTDKDDKTDKDSKKDKEVKEDKGISIDQEVKEAKDDKDLKEDGADPYKSESENSYGDENDDSSFEKDSKDQSEDSEESKVPGVSVQCPASKVLKTSARRIVESEPFNESTGIIYETKSYGIDSASVHFQTRVE